MSLSDRATTVQSLETLCYYVNATNQIQFIRVVKDRCFDDGAVAPSSPSETRKALPSVSLAPALKDTASHNAGSHRHLSVEKIVFPQQRILFEAMSEAQLEIYNSPSEDLRIAKVIPCRNLEVN